MRTLFVVVYVSFSCFVATAWAEEENLDVRIPEMETVKSLRWLAWSLGVRLLAEIQTAEMETETEPFHYEKRSVPEFIRRAKNPEEVFKEYFKSTDMEWNFDHPCNLLHVRSKGMKAFEKNALNVHMDEVTIEGRSFDSLLHLMTDEIVRTGNDVLPGGLDVEYEDGTAKVLFDMSPMGCDGISGETPYDIQWKGKSDRSKDDSTMSVTFETGTVREMLVRVLDEFPTMTCAIYFYSLGSHFDDDWRPAASYEVHRVEFFPRLDLIEITRSMDELFEKREEIRKREGAEGVSFATLQNRREGYSFEPDFFMNSFRYHLLYDEDELLKRLSVIDFLNDDPWDSISSCFLEEVRNRGTQSCLDFIVEQWLRLNDRERRRKLVFSLPSKQALGGRYKGFLEALEKDDDGEMKPRLEDKRERDEEEEWLKEKKGWQRVDQDDQGQPSKRVYIEELMTIKANTGGLWGICFSPDGKFLASPGHDANVILLDVATGKVVRTFIGHSEHVCDVSFSPDGKFLASGSSDKTIKIWNVESSEETRTLVGHEHLVSSVCFSPDGKILASGGLDNTIRQWDVATGRELRSITGHYYWVLSVCYAPDGKTLASGSLDNTIILWDSATGENIRTLSGHRVGVESVAFGPDGVLLASAGDDHTVRLWDVATGKELKVMMSHTDRLLAVSLSPDGKILASGGWDDILKLWDVETGREVQSSNIPGDISICSVSFSPDGNILAAGLMDGRIIFWRMASDD